MTAEEINEACARKLGWEKTEDGQWSRTDPFGGRVLKWRHFDYCHKIEAAWQIVEYMAKTQLVSLCFHDAYWHCEINCCDGEIGIDEEADTAPMAICLAFLKLKKG